MTIAPTPPPACLGEPVGGVDGCCSPRPNGRGEQPHRGCSARRASGRCGRAVGSIATRDRAVTGPLGRLPVELISAPLGRSRDRGQPELGRPRGCRRSVGGDPAWVVRPAKSVSVIATFRCARSLCCVPQVMRRSSPVRPLAPAGISICPRGTLAPRRAPCVRPTEVATTEHAASLRHPTPRDTPPSPPGFCTLRWVVSTQSAYSGLPRA